jgi:hypothetical protein
VNLDEVNSIWQQRLLVVEQKNVEREKKYKELTDIATEMFQVLGMATPWSWVQGKGGQEVIDSSGDWTKKAKAARRKFLDFAP